MIKQSGSVIYCFDPKYSKYMRMGNKIGSIFYKRVEAKNFMRVVNGYGLQYDAFSDLGRLGVKEIRVIEENGNVWLSKYNDWRISGKVADYGRGKQIFLSMKYMSLKTQKNKEDENSSVMGLFNKMDESKRLIFLEAMKKAIHKGKT